MASLEMNGPYTLDVKTIDEKITKTSPGNYALGSKSERGTFLVGYVGRSDSDLGARLKSWVGETTKPLFRFSYSSSAKTAFEKECNNYHDFDPPKNDVHPDRPINTNWTCPRCDVFN